MRAGKPRAESPEARQDLWNAPSFKIDDHFATFKLHPPKSLQIVLHTGAKPKEPQRAFALDDPHDLLKWPAIDRCVVTLESPDQAVELREVVVGLVRSWMEQLGHEARMGPEK